MLIWRRIITTIVTTKLVDQHTIYRTGFLRLRKIKPCDYSVHYLAYMNKLHAQCATISIVFNAFFVIGRNYY